MVAGGEGIAVAEGAGIVVDTFGVLMVVALVFGLRQGRPIAIK